MMSFIPPRLRKPLYRTLAGLLIAGAWAIGSSGAGRWPLTVVIAVASLGQGVIRYAWAGEDTDEGALLGSRADERQQLVGQQALALAGKIALAAAYIGVLVTLAVKQSDVWPFLAMFAITGFGYLLGLSNYGSGEPAADDGMTVRHHTRSPVSR
jgi:hypothetical protein